MKRIGGMNQGGRFPIGMQRKQFTYQNPPGFFPFIMKGFEFYNPPINQVAMGMNKIERAINQLYSQSAYRCIRCGMRFQRHSQLKEHLDYHFQQSVLTTERRSGPLTRKPFSTYLNWVSDSNIDIINNNQETLTREQQELENCVPFSTSENSCFVCGEEFKTILKADDEWYFINCKKMRINKLIVKVHVSNCSKFIEEQVTKYNEKMDKIENDQTAQMK